MTSFNRSIAVVMLAFSGLMLAAYFGLVSYFDFPDILRQDTARILTLFTRNQATIVTFYYLFVLAQLSFIGMVLMLHHYYQGRPSVWLTIATGFGVLAGLCQAIGFLRWPFLAPYLAEVMADSSTTPAMKEMALILFQSFHQFAGVAVGENLFFLLEGLWAVTFSCYLYRHKQLSTGMAGILFFSGMAILVYSLEQFGGVFSVLAPLNILAHGAIVFWSLAMARRYLVSRKVVNVDNRVGTMTTVVLWTGYLAIVVPGLI